MYTRDQLRPVWNRILREGGDPPNGPGIPGGANVIVAVIVFYGEKRKWPTVGDLVERLLPGANANLEDLRERINELDSMGDVKMSHTESTGIWDSVVALSPARIEKVNEVLDKNGIAKLNVA